MCAVAWLAAAQVAAADPVTTRTFLAELNNFGAKSNGTVERFDCGSSAKDADRTACVGNIKFGPFGISVMVHTSKNADAVAQAVAMMAAPEVMPDDMKPLMTATFLAMADHFMETFSPELSQDKRTAALEKLMTHLDNDPDEVKIGERIYAAGAGMMLVFSVERADDQRTE